MRSIRSQSKLENRVTKALWHKGLRFRKNVKSLPGAPDIAIKKYKVAVFIDSCFWHGCPDHFRLPESNTEYWARKIAKNKNRDQNVTSHYVSSGWRILRVWEHEFKEDFDAAVTRIAEFIRQDREASLKYP